MVSLLAYSRLLAGSPASLGWRDVLVDTEEIRRVVCGLHGNEAVVVASVGRLDSLRALLAQIVDVDPPGGKRLHRLPALVRPLHVLCGLGVVGPDRHAEKTV